MAPLLVVAATEFEAACCPALPALVTGAGIPATLLRLLSMDQLPSRFLNVGIAGAYPDSRLAIGDVVAVEAEVFGDMGMETKDGFLPIGSFPFGEFYAEPLDLEVPEWLDHLTTVKSSTVNTCTGSARVGAERARLFGAQIETMEGAAVALAGKQLGIPVTQIRAISNIASERDMRPDNIDRALDSLRAVLSDLPLTG